MSLTTGVILIGFAWMLGAQWARIRTDRQWAAAIESRAEQMATGFYRMPAPSPILHPDQDGYGRLPPVHNPWKAFEEAKLRHFKPKTLMRYERFRQPQPARNMRDWYEGFERQF